MAREDRFAWTNPRPIGLTCQVRGEPMTFRAGADPRGADTLWGQLPTETRAKLDAGGCDRRGFGAATLRLAEASGGRVDLELFEDDGSIYLGPVGGEAIALVVADVILSFTWDGLAFDLPLRRPAAGDPDFWAYLPAGARGSLTYQGRDAASVNKALRAQLARHKGPGVPRVRLDVLPPLAAFLVRVVPSLREKAPGTFEAPVGAMPYSPPEPA